MLSKYHTSNLLLGGTRRLENVQRGGGGHDMTWFDRFDMVCLIWLVWFGSLGSFGLVGLVLLIWYALFYLRLPSCLKTSSYLRSSSFFIFEVVSIFN